MTDPALHEFRLDNDHVALCQYLRTSSVESVSRTEFRDGGSAIVGEIRLTNRTSLLQELALDVGNSDASIVLAGYDHWGEDVLDRLEGAFAFSIYKPVEGSLFCARDRFGTKPYYFSISEDGFSFCSEPAGLLIEGRRRDLDRQRVAEFVLGINLESSSTFFTNIKRLPAAHFMSIDREGYRARRYWSIRPSSAGYSRKTAATTFRRIFTQAVKTQMGDHPSAMLSGGLDSSAIVAVAGRELEATGQKLKTFSIVFPETPEADEKEFSSSVASSTPNVVPSFAAFDGYDPLEDIDLILRAQNGPVIGPNICLINKLYSVASKAGAVVILDGHGGDEIVSHGYGRFPQLAYQDRWFEFARLLKSSQDAVEVSRLRMFKAYFMHFAVRRRIRRVLTAVFGERSERSTSHRIQGSMSRLNESLLTTTDIVAKYRKANTSQALLESSEQLDHASNILSPVQAHAFEMLDVIAGRNGLEPRYPFWHRPLVEFCLSLAPEMKFDFGWSRLTMRLAMKGLLPNSVRWRRKKLDFRLHIARGLVGYHRVAMEQLTSSKSLCDFVNEVELAGSVERVLRDPDGSDGSDVFFVWRCLTLDRWLGTLAR